MEERRLEAARQSMVSQWNATVGREVVSLVLKENGTYQMKGDQGVWTLDGMRLFLVPQGMDISQVESYRYELLDNFLTLSEGGLATPLRFVRTGSSSGFLRGYAEWLSNLSWEGLEHRMFRVLSVCGIVVISVLLLSFIRWLSGILIFSNWGPLSFLYRKNKNRARTVHSVVINLLKYIIYFTALGQILNELGINYTTYIASLSVIGLAVGFGSQGFVQDIVTGFFLLFDGQFSVGDMVEISGQTGIVEEMGLRTTRIKNYIGQSVVIPNRNIALVGNYSKGHLEVYTDIAVSPEEKADDWEDKLTMMSSEFYRQFDGTLLQKPESLGLITLKTGESFLRLRFTLWPQQQAFFDSQIVPRIREFLGREGIDNPASRISVFFRHPDVKSSGKWPFYRRKEQENQETGSGI